MRQYALSLCLLVLAGCEAATTKSVVDVDNDGFSDGEDCDDNDPTVGAPTTYYVDADADGHGDPNASDASCSRPEGYSEAGDDCDDAVATTYPGAPELCDGIDNDCDGVIDNGTSTTMWHPDADGDGYGDAATSVDACTAPAGMIQDASDCNDADNAINPAAAEVCDDLDNNCDGFVDEGVGTSTWYADNDGDGYGDDATATTTCAPPAGSVETGGDCDDADADYHPYAAEDCTDPNDYNCDGSVGYADNDGDSYAACEECNDGDAAVFPGADETCNGLDDDCDGSIDEDVLDPSTWYADLDGDTYGDPATVVASCDAPAGYVADGTDCDDGRADINPAAAELCDGYDNDCDALVDDADPSLDATSASTWYTDVDGDGYGDDASAVLTCTAPVDSVSVGGDCDDTSLDFHPGAAETDCTDPNDYNCDGSVGTVDNDGDGYYACEECDDANAANFPGATEYCDGADNDCDGTVDEADAVDATNWYADADADGYGDPTVAVTACSDPGGYTADGTDCDDADFAVNPAELEVCNGIDDNCDGVTDTDAADATTWYVDLDGDGFGDPRGDVVSCSAPAGYVADDTDCDDSTAAVNPGAAEVCDGLDNDCDGTTDMGLGSTWYADDDGDGFGDAADTTLACDVPAGYSADDTDCDDADASVNPGATEVCDGLDNDCDTLVDEAGAATTYYADIDADGYGDAAATTTGCSVPAGYVADSSDCDDTRADISPAASEVCDGLDNDCDTLVDDADGSLDTSTASTWYTDADSDGYGDDTSSTLACDAPAGAVALGGDCDDSDPAYNPGAIEADCTDPHDYNCDGSVGATDADGDGYYACEECDDGDATINPAATELCDAVDNDCDGTVDEADAADASTWYADADVDGYGDATSVDIACSAPSGYVADDTDCDDSDSAINPAQAELCNGIDDDCDGAVDDGVTTGTYYADADSDGYGDSGATTTACAAPAGYVADATDCDDTEATVNPAASELCDSLDNNCDGFIDEGVKTRYYADSDGDAYGDSATTTTACSAPAGYVTDATDCDDSDATVHPAATETCNGTDDDCDGSVDEGLATTTYYADADGDTYGNASVTTTACSAPAGYVSNSTDCNDANSAVNPGATEVCDYIDNDCDGFTDEKVRRRYYADADKDKYGNPSSSTVAFCSLPSGYVRTGTDCDDTSSSIHPGATELCNGVDDDCDGTVDDGITYTTYYADADGDAYGDASSTGTSSCTTISGYVTDDTDCDDTEAAVNPGETEICNSIDDNCDGSVDEGLGSTWYADADGDSYGNPTTAATACSAPAGYVAVSDDCDDTDAAVNPAATEVCNSTDDDCDGSVDEGLSSTWYADADGDTYGDATTSASSCSAPAGYVANSTDCDDTAAAVNPGETEICNTIDDDCDGAVDEGLGATLYADVDGDGYGDSTSALTTCSSPVGYVTNSLDCDDGNAAIHPGATEVCDGIDNDCDGSIDDGLSVSSYYADVDTDGYGDAGSAVSACAVPPAYVADSTDCDDTDAAVHPGAAEVCDGADNDCDGSIDEGLVISSYYADADSDTYGDASTATSSCAAPAGYVANSTDCDDTKAAINPGATEVCDGADNDCDGSIDEGVLSTYYVDADSDAYGVSTTSITACSLPAGYAANSTDCNDADATINPGATEVCDEVDNDCDGSIDEGFVSATWYDDADGDGYGDPDTAVSTCDGAPAGYVADNTDCDDTDAAVNPAATEVCDGMDNNCDGSIDEGGVCPCDVEEYDGHAYMFCDSGDNWVDARTQCLTYGYDMADIDDAAENTWLAATATTYSGGQWWVGLSDRDVEGVYAWSTGLTVSYTNWQAGKPSGKSKNDCVRLKLSTGTWSDTKCTNNNRYICEE